MFYLTDASINGIANAILSGVFAFYLFSLKKKDKATLMLMFFFLFYTIFSIRLTVHVSLISTRLLPVTEIGMVFLYIGMMFLTPFALYFYKTLSGKTTKILIAISIIVTAGVAIGVVLTAVFNPWSIFLFDTDQFFFQNSTRIVGPPASILTIVATSVFFYKAHRFSESEAKGLKRIFRPVGRFARASRNFAILCFGLIIQGVIGILAGTKVINYDTARVMMILIMLFVLFFLVMVYLNNSTQPSNMIIKIVGISLATIIIIFVLLGYYLTETVRQNYHEARLAEIRLLQPYMDISRDRALEFGQVIRDKNVIIPESIQYIAARPVSDGYYSENYTMLYNVSGNLSADILKQSDDYEKGNRIKALIRYKRIDKTAFMDKDGVERYPTEEEATAMARDILNQEPVPEYTRSGRLWDMSDITTYYTKYNLTSGGMVYELGYRYTDYRQAQHRTSVFLLVILILISIIIIVLFPLFFRNIITEPIRRLLKGVRSFNQGDLSVEIPVMVLDEIGFLSTSFNNMAQNFRTILQDLQSAAEHVSDSSREMTTTAQALSHGAGQQAVSLEQSTSSMEEVSLSIYKISLNCQDQASSVEEITAAIDQLNNSMDEIYKAAKRVSDGADKAVSQALKAEGSSVIAQEGMKKIEDSSNKIYNIINVINDIAEQTNLLSLNASIEAARAGVAGRGFAVVADEISKLADESVKAVKEIEKLIKETGVNVKNGSRMVNELNQVIKEMMKVAEFTGKEGNEMGKSIEEQLVASKEITKSIENVNILSQGIAESSEKISITTDELSKGLEDVNDVTQQAAGSAEELTAAAEELSAQADHLNELFEQFSEKKDAAS